MKPKTLITKSTLDKTQRERTQIILETIGTSLKEAKLMALLESCTGLRQDKIINYYSQAVAEFVYAKKVKE